LATANYSSEEKISSERQSCGWKCLVESSQRRIARLVQDNSTKKKTKNKTLVTTGVLQHVQPWSRLTKPAEDIPGDSPSAITGNWGYNNTHILTLSPTLRKPGKLKVIMGVPKHHLQQAASFPDPLLQPADIHTCQDWTIEDRRKNIAWFGVSQFLLVTFKC